MPKQPDQDVQQNGQDNGNQDGSSQRKMQGEILTLDAKISRQTPQGDVHAPQKNQYPTHNQKDQTQKDKKASERCHG
jgi:hypothetical protein